MESGGSDDGRVDAMVEVVSRTVSCILCLDNNRIIKAEAANSLTSCFSLTVQSSSVMFGPTSFSDLFTNYCETLLKESGASDTAAVEALLDRLCCVIEFLPERGDAFRCAYQTKLGKRLLNNLDGVHLSLDRHFVEKMTSALGLLFTHSLRVMVRDYEAWNALQPSPRHESSATNTMFQVQVLTAIHWPAF